MNRALLTFLVAPVITGACFLGGNPNGGPDGGGGPDSDSGTVLAFSPDPPSVYVSKVKNLLTGLPASQSDINTVAGASDPQAALKGLIDGWMATPQYADKMKTFFELAFQQTQIGPADFVPLVPNQGSLGNGVQIDLLLQNVREMFARTVIELIAEGKPLSTAFTTNTFMMTPPLMELMSFLDWNQVDDAGNVVDTFAKAFPKTNIIVQSTDSAITYADTIQQGGPDFMNWYFPNLTTDTQNDPTVCQASSRTYQPSAHTVHYLMYGMLDVIRINGTRCNQYNGNGNSLFTTADFGDTAWKMVTVRTPNKGEATTPFWDATTLRSTNTLVLNTPRVGFYSTPAFQANWPTNTSNTMRVTMNQAFIVALGAQVDGSDTTNPGPNPPGLDQSHASAGAACLGCHQILDPSRSILQATYSYGYGVQNDAGLAAQKGEFVFNNQIAPVSTISDLGAQLAKHVFYPGAWVQKLCFFANSQACDPADPEYQRMVSDFQSTGQWKTLIEDVFSSPITTNAASTMTTSTAFTLNGSQFGGELVSVARRDHLCTLLNARLQLTDVCGLDVVRSGPPTSGVPQIAQGLPSDGYGRGAPIPVLPAQPTLFFRAGLENICEDVGNMIIDNGNPPAGAKTYSSTSQANVNAAIADFVSNLMGIVPSDPASAEMTTLLQGVYSGTLGISGAKPTDALKSTFITACESPNVAGIGL